MPRFFLLDHSLKRVGGHHFDYALHTANAADQLGFEVVLATNRRFAERRRLPEHWRVVSPFRYTTYQPYTLNARHPDPAFRRGWRRWVKQIRSATSPIRSVWRGIDRERRLRAFVEGCDRVFRNCPLRFGDEVFIPTISDFDLLGLVRFMKRDERTQLANWHLQFHFNVFQGREPEYAAQAEQAELARQRLQEPLEQLRERRVYLYTTCQPLARQFNQLGLADFQPLAYPVDPRFSQPAAKPVVNSASQAIVDTTLNNDAASNAAIDAGRSEEGRDEEAARTDVPDASADHVEVPNRAGRIRLTMAGCVRQEKGHSRLQQLVDELQPELAERAKLVIQSDKSWFRLEGVDNESPPDWIEFAPHPLEPDQYVRLIRDADVGLLLYDSRRYYARRAGILGEYLAAGKPVIVPAGCWLGEQLVEPGCRHVEALMDRLPSSPVAEMTSVTTGTEPSWQRVHANPGDALLLRFHWDPSVTPGSYIRITVRQNDESSQPLDSQTEIAGQRVGGGAVSVLFSLHAETRFVQAEWRNAYDDRPLNLYDIRMQQLHSTDSRPIPRSAVGVAFADWDGVADSVRELLLHPQHYGESAERFAQGWVERHDPTRTVTQLIESGARTTRSAA